MRHCNACDISVRAPLDHCPLCYTTLSSEHNYTTISSYPELLDSNEAHSLIIRILLFISLTIIAVCVTINFLNTNHYPWSAIVAICIAYVWIALGTVIRKHHRMGLNLLTQLVSLGVLLLLLASIIGFKSAVYNYVFPALVASAMLSFNILSVVRRKNIQPLLLYYLIVGALGFLPLVLFFTGQVTVAWPAICCAVYCGMSIISVFVFAYRSTKSELIKRFHI